MSNVVEQLTPNPVNHKHGENGCCKNPRAWEMEMMHQVWAAGLHDAANCFQDALEAKLFFMVFYLYGYFGVGKICIENPVPSKIF